MATHVAGDLYFNIDGQLPCTILARLYGDEKIVLPAIRGSTRTIAGTSDVFRGWIDSNFTNWDLDKPSHPTPRMPVAIYELQTIATFAQMFGELADNPRKLVLTQSQIILFCDLYRNKLRQDGWAMFFLFEENGELFVARVHLYDRELGVYASRFGDESVWDTGSSGNRIVSPATVVLGALGP